MFWNAEFLDSSPSRVDVLLQIPTAKLSDILFEEDLLQELKTSNPNLANFLNRSEIINELVDNITQLTEKDCCDKSLYSKVHAAYISCEILTSGTPDVFAHLISCTESLIKIISCLTVEPKQRINTGPPEDSKSPADVQDSHQSVSEETIDEIEANDEDSTETDKVNSPKQPPKVVDTENPAPISLELLMSSNLIKTKVVPQKANLVSKLISAIHSVAPAVLSCHISQNIGLFSRLIDLLVDNIDISGSFEILCTFIKPTSTMQQQSTELRYSFCEILGKLHFVDKLIDVMTNSDSDDKQRNACQLLCDIIVLGRQCAADQKDQPVSFDLLSELLQSRDRVKTILEHIFSKEERNSTAIICGMKVLQIMIEKKNITDAPLVSRAIGEAQEAIEKYLIYFHELLLNPPKQEPIKTNFGIIQKPLGYIRLEVVNLIRALISTNSPIVIKKLVELKTMKVIIDLFIEYSWNNLLHTQVEQALCLIINNYRGDEESSYQTQIIEIQHILDKHQHDEYAPANEVATDIKRRMQQQRELSPSNLEQQATEFPSRALLSQILNECDLIGRLLSPSGVTNSNINGTIVKDQDTELSNKENASSHDSNSEEASDKILSATNDIISECSDNLRRVELEHQRRKNGEQANFGHIIQMINSIAINRDLDTIRDHLNEMKDRRPDLHDRWTTFVNVDVASFKEISLFYDVQSANNNVNHRFGQNNQSPNNQHLMDSSNSSHVNSANDNENSQNNNEEDQLYAYFSFTKEVVLPNINIDVLPKNRRSQRELR